MPLTFRISYRTWFVVLSSQIILSGSKPDPCVFFTIIISPMSCTYRPHRLASLYVSALFANSVADKNRLHRNCPLLRRIAVYSNHCADFDAQSIAIRCSPFGVATLLHPVRTAKSFPSYLESSWFQSSTLPVYLR